MICDTNNFSKGSDKIIIGNKDVTKKEKKRINVLYIYHFAINYLRIF